MSTFVLGGGISGLSTAFYLSKKCKNGIVLCEASDRLGGYIRTRINGNGSQFEQGARTIRFSGSAGENLREMTDELGISSSMKPTDRLFKNRFFYINNKLHNLPSSWTALFKKNSIFDEPLAAPIMRDVFGNRKKVDDESVYDFIFRRFGKRYADVFSAIICGIYAGNADEISVKSALRSAFEKEQKYGSLCLGFVLDSVKSWMGRGGSAPKKNSDRVPPATGVWYLEGGMERLPTALKDYLAAKGTTDIRLNAKCDRIEFIGRQVRLHLGGETELAEHLYSSVPSKELLKLLGTEHGYLKEELAKIPFVSVAVVNLEYEENVLPVKGFGLLVPPNQKLPVLGIIFDSCLQPQGDKTVLTVMMGGRWFEEYLGPDPGEAYVLKLARDHVSMILNVDETPANHHVSILRHCDTVERINRYISQKKLPLTLVGNSYGGVGIPDTILSARRGVESQFKEPSS